jgi:hypothetical protein
MTVPERSLNADPDRLFNYAAANDDHAERRHAQLESRDETALFVAGGTTGLATTVQDFRDLAVAYRAHGRHKLAAELHSAVRIVFRTESPRCRCPRIRPRSSSPPPPSSRSVPKQRATRCPARSSTT